MGERRRAKSVPGSDIWPLETCKDIRAFLENRKRQMTDERVAIVKTHRDRCADCVNWILCEVLTALTTKRSKKQMAELERVRDNLREIKSRLGDTEPVAPRLINEVVERPEFAKERLHRFAAMRR